MARFFCRQILLRLETETSDEGAADLHNGMTWSGEAVGAVYEAVKESDPEDKETSGGKGPLSRASFSAGEVAPGEAQGR
jgi:hypothetical protein